MSWYLNTNYSREVQAAFKDIKHVLSLEMGELVSSSSLSSVKKLSIENTVFYIKCYYFKGKKIRKWLGRSRARAEWENILFCEKLNIAVPNLVAYGESYSFLGLNFKYAVLITEEIPGALNLKQIALEKPAYFKNKQWREKVMKQIANYVRLLHQHKFLHYDLQWRNILVTADLEHPRVYFLDIPSGRIRKHFFSRLKNRDFYNLYKSAVLFISKTDQLRFYLNYMKIKFLTQNDKNCIKSIIKYTIKKERQDQLNLKKSL